MTLDFRTDFALEKSVALGLALAFAALLPERGLIYSYIVLGHAHFVLTYLYQSRRQKPAPRQVALYGAVLAISFYLAFQHYNEFIIYIAALFLFHNFFDEFKILGKPLDFFHGAMIALLVAVPVLWLAQSVYAIDMYGVVTAAFVFWLLAQAALCGFLLSRREKLPLHTNTVILGLVITFVLGLHLTHTLLTPAQLFGFIILFHFFSWYIHLARKFKGRADAGASYKRYLKDCAVVNAAVISIFGVYMAFPETLSFMHKAFFSLAGYYAWTNMHLLTTFRLSDYMQAFSYLVPKSLRA